MPYGCTRGRGALRALQGTRHDAATGRMDRTDSRDGGGAQGRRDVADRPSVPGLQRSHRGRRGQARGPSENSHSEAPSQQALLRAHRIRRVPNRGLAVHPADRGTGECAGLRIRRKDRGCDGRRHVAGALPGKVPVRVRGHQHALSESERYRQRRRSNREPDAADRQVSPRPSTP